MIRYMNRKGFLIMFCLLTVMSFLIAGTTVAYASETTGADNQRIFDNAGLLSTNEVEELTKMCLDYGEEAGIGIFIITHDDPRAKDGEIYIEDFYDQGLYGDSVFLLVDMYNRDVVLEGYGKAENYLHSKRLDVIREAITPYLSGEDYYTAFEMFIGESARYMKDDSELNYDSDYSYNSPGYSYDYNSGYSQTYPSYDSYQTANTVESVLKNVWFQLIASLVIGTIVVGIMASGAGGRMTAGANNYIDGGNSGLIGRRDIYLRTTVTRVHRPKQNNTNGGFNAGGFRGGISSGGHSHSTSRGKF